MRTADILVVLGEVSREAELFGQLVPVAFEDGLDVLQSIEPGPGGDAAGGIEAGGRVLLAQVQQTQTDLVGLLGVIPALKLAADPQQRIWADIRRPALEAPGRPLLLSPVARWHVGRVGGKAWPVLARVRGDELPSEVGFHQGLAGVQFQPLPHVLVRHRVVVVLVLHVVVDIDLYRLDVPIAVRLARQRPECGSVELLEGRLATARQLLEGPTVQVLQQGADALVELSQGEEGVVAQTSQDPALDDLYRHLGFGLVLGLVGPRRDDGDLVVLRPLLVTGVQVRIVAARFADTAA